MKSAKVSVKLLIVLFLFFWSVGVSEAVPMSTAFTYQGRLMDSNEVADGVYDFEFKLFDSITEGDQLGEYIFIPSVEVSDGYFTVDLAFDNNEFNGEARWLEIGVRPEGEEVQPTVLSPRQELTPSPYALYAQTAGMDSDWMVSDSNVYLIGSGNVGIGTTVPSDKLQVWGETIRLYHPSNIWGYGTRFHFGDSTYAWIGEPNDDKMELHGSQGIFLTGGNVGVGKTNPFWKLDVEGEYGVRAFATSGGAGHFTTGSGNFSDCLYIQSWAGVGNMIECRRGSMITDAEFRVTGNGNVQADGTFSSPCADFAELVETDGEFEAGDVLVIGNEGKFSLSSEPGSTLVAGIYSTKPAFIGGSSINVEDNAGKIPMAVMGIVPC